MPLAKQFAFLRESVRTRPVMTATSAATAGVLLGGFVAFQLLATPQPQSAGAGTAQAAVETKAAPRPAPETTGSAAAGQSAAAADCDQQTWPHLSRACMEEYRSKNRAPRVVSTDRLDKSAIAAVEASPPASADKSKLAAPARWAPSVASPAPPAVAPPIKTVSAPPQAAAPAPVAIAAPEPLPVASTTDAQTTSQAAVKNEAKDKRDAKKSKRKPKAEPRAPANDDDSTVASNDSDDRASGDRADRRPDRSRRIVERWTERDYDVPDARGDGRRRVTVIRRSGGGLFESLFGN